MMSSLTNTKLIMIDELRNKLTSLLSEYEEKGKEFGIRASEIRNVIRMITPQMSVEIKNDEWAKIFNEKSSKEDSDVRSMYFSDCDTLTKTANRYTELTKEHGGDMKVFDEITKEYYLNKKFLIERNNGL
jgi:hypothetical protein